MSSTNQNLGECTELKQLGFTPWFENMTEGKPYAFSNVAVKEEIVYRIIDDAMLGELWFSLDEEGYCDDFLAVYRSDNKNKMIFEFWHKDVEEKKLGTARLTMQNDLDIPINVDVVDALALEDLKMNDEVSITITCFHKEINFYEDAKSCKEGNKGLAVESCIPIGTTAPNGNKDNDFKESPYAIISGKVKEYEIRTNSLTGMKYIHYSLESLGMVYDVVVAEDEDYIQPSNVQYISGVFYLTGHIDTQNYERQGNSYCNGYIKKLSEEVFSDKVANTLRILRDMAYEFIIADFGEASNYPIGFIQGAIKAITEKGKGYLIEYGKLDDEGNPLLYRLVPDDDFCSYEMAKKIFYVACVEGKEPLDWQWEDVTYIIKE